MGTVWGEYAYVEEEQKRGSLATWCVRESFLGAGMQDPNLKDDNIEAREGGIAWEETEK